MNTWENSVAFLCTMAAILIGAAGLLYWGGL